MSFDLNDADYFFISAFLVNIILYSWMHFKCGSGKAMNEIKYGDRASAITQFVFIVILFIIIVGIFVFILGAE